MNNQRYWERRKAQQMYEYMEDAERTARELGTAYKKASIYVRREAEKIFDRYRRKYALSEREAKELLKVVMDPTDVEAIKALLAADPKNMELLKELESHAYGARLNNLSNLQGQIDALVLSIFWAEQKKSQALYRALASEAYYNSIFDMQQYAGYGFKFKLLDEKNIRRALKAKWYGKNFSQRLWNNTHALAKALKEELIINLLTGRPLKVAQEEIEKKFSAGYDNARRLVRTESAFICNHMQLKSYQACGVKKYIYLAILDLKTSLVCRSLDKERFSVEDATPGRNYPPMHPWCRSTTIANMPDKWLQEMKQSAIDPATGKRIIVPGDMTYRQWYKKFVHGKENL